MGLKKELQDVIFLDQQRRKEIRFLCFFSTCPPESLKVTHPQATGLHTVQNSLEDRGNAALDCAVLIGPCAHSL